MHEPQTAHACRPDKDTEVYAVMQRYPDMRMRDPSSLRTAKHVDGRSVYSMSIEYVEVCTRPAAREAGSCRLSLET
jgi:hypothetical protein